jgi:hypothetical protein
MKTAAGFAVDYASHLHRTMVDPRLQRARWEFNQTIGVHYWRDSQSTLSTCEMFVRQQRQESVDGSGLAN